MFELFTNSFFKMNFLWVKNNASDIWFPLHVNLFLLVIVEDLQAKEVWIIDVS